MEVPEILIISNRYDFACDYVCSVLSQKQQKYLRLNTDDLSRYHIHLNPLTIEFIIKFDDKEFCLSEQTLKSIFFRGPTYLRETSMLNLTPEQKLEKSQWASFIRTLMIFENCLWVNHPGKTYVAETKAVQLKIAKQLEFDVPTTIITNSDNWLDADFNEYEELVVKGIDTIYLGVGDKQAFGYTNIVDKKELSYDSLAIAPVFIQQYLSPKIDLRVTVIGSSVFAVQIVEDGRGIEGDWRLKKNNVRYNPTDLPTDLIKKCILLVRKLGLNYGAIDLALVGSRYYFIEINPTGEWAWLVNQSKLPIDEAIANFLIYGYDQE